MSWNWSHQQHQPPWRPTWQHGQNVTRPPALLATPPAPIDWAARAREWASHAQNPNPVPRAPQTACPIRTSVPPPPPPPIIPSSMRSDEPHNTQILNIPQNPNNQVPGANNPMSKPWEWNRNWPDKANQPPPPVPPVLSVAPPDPSVAPPVWNTTVRPPIQRDLPSVDYNRPPPPPGVESWNPDFKDAVTSVRPPHAPVFDYNHGQNRSLNDVHISNHANEESKNHQTHSFHHSTPRHLVHKHHEQSPQHDRQHTTINLDNSKTVGTSFHGFSQGQSNHNQLNLSPHSYTNRHTEISNSAEENETSSEGTATTTVASAAQKRRQLPAWIREQLEKIKAKEVQKAKHDASEEKSLADTDDDSLEQTSNYQNGMEEAGETTRKSTADMEKQEKVKDSPVARSFEKFQTTVSEHSQSSTPKENPSHSSAPMTKEEREFGTLRICSDILLGVTSLMIEEVSKEVIEKAKRRREAKKARESTNSGTKLPTLGLGLIAYDVESSESGSDVGGTRTGVPEITDEEDSDDELRKQIALKRLRFEQKIKELEEEHREEPRRRHHSSSKRSTEEPEDGRSDRRSPSRGNDFSRGAGHEAKEDDVSIESRQRKNRARHRRRNKDRDRHSDDSSDRVSRDTRLKRRSDSSAKHSRRHDRRSSVSESSPDSHRHRRHRARKSDTRNTSVSSSRRRHGRRYRQDDSSPSSRYERSRRDVSLSYSSSSGERHRQRDRRRLRKREEDHHRRRRSSSTEVSSRKRKLDDSKSRPSKVSSKGENPSKPSKEKKKKSKEKKRRKASSGNSVDDDKETYSGKQ